MFPALLQRGFFPADEFNFLIRMNELTAQGKVNYFEANK
jgi:hypothetical protein